MIILDTDVLSELVRSEPSPTVIGWARAQPRAEVFTTVICEAELLVGIATMPEGRRRADLARAVSTILTVVLGGRVLPFDRDAARIYADLFALSKRVGRPVGAADLQVAAIARARNAEAIATRNVLHFQDAGIPLINPWQPGA